MAEVKEAAKTFAELGICDELVEACEKLGWKSPTKIKDEAIPLALQGKDLTAIAQTGTGKTAAFALPVLQSLLQSSSDSPGSHAFFACVLSPTSGLQDYIHRVGRTARAGRPGYAISLVNDFEPGLFSQIEEQIGQNIDKVNPNQEEVFLFSDRVTEAKRTDRKQIKESGGKKREYREDEEDEIAKYLSIKDKKFKKMKK